MKIDVRRSSVILGIAAVGVAICYKSCILTDKEIVASDWKYADDQASLSEPAEFFWFRSGAHTVRNDTIYGQGFPIALIKYAYRKYGGTDRLIVTFIASGRSVEYIDF